MKKYIIVIYALLSSLYLNANHWQPNPYQFENNMISIGVIKIDGIEQRSENLEIGAFCDGDCRGSAIAVYNSAFDRFFVFLMIYGSEADEIYFRIYDHQLELEPEVESLSSMVFHPNGQEGNVDNPFEFVFESFPPDRYEIIASVEPENAGYVSGTGIFYEGDTCTIEISENDGFHYLYLTEDGNIVATEKEYSFQVTENHCFIANFGINQYDVSINVNPENSAVVTGDATYFYGEECTVTVMPYPHWHFQNWTLNGSVVSTETEYSFVVTENINLTANLYYYDSVEENENIDLKIFPNPAKDVIFVELGLKPKNIVITNTQGQVVRVLTDRTGLVGIDISDLRAGMYNIHCDNELRKIIKN